MPISITLTLTKVKTFLKIFYILSFYAQIIYKISMWQTAFKNLIFTGDML